VGVVVGFGDAGSLGDVVGSIDGAGELGSSGKGSSL